MDTPSAAISFGPFVLDLARGELLRAGELVSLAPKPLALLSYLAANRERAVPKQELRRHVWPDVFVSEAALASALKDLRRALGDDGSRQGVIRTLRRRGYRFVAKLEPAQSGRARGRTHSAAPARPLPPPFIARGRELRSLTSWASQAARGRPRVVLISGDAGAGKTRLLEQLAAHPVCAEFAVAVGRCPSDAPLPYLPFAEALGARLLDGDEGAEQSLGDDAALLRPLLQLDAPPSRAPEPLHRGDGARDRAELFAALWRLVTRLAQRRATLLAIEDLHCADAASLDLFAHLAACLADARASESPRLLLVGTMRTPEPSERLAEVVRRIEASPACGKLHLSGFGVGATGRLIDGLGGGRLAPEAVRRIQLATDGNPLFIREVVRHGESAQPLATRDSGEESYRAERPRADGLRVAIGARVARLTPAARGVLGAAAAIGERFGLLALCAVTRSSEDAARAALREAEREELVVGEQRSFRFDHPLIREVVAEGLPEGARRELHRDVAAVLEDLYAASPGEHAIEIARHLVRAGELVEPARLIDYARRASDQASALCAWREAAQFNEAALGAAAQLQIGERAALNLRAGIAANHDYDAEKSLRHYARAADAFAEARDDVGLAWSLLYLTRARFTFASDGQGLKLELRPLEELVTRFGESHPALRARLLEAVAEAHWVAGDVELARVTAERALAIANLADDDVVSHQVYLGLGLAQLSQLRVREALDSWLECAERARRTRDPWLQAMAAPRIALALLHLGRLDEARERGRSALELARRAHNVGELGFACAHLAAIEGVTGAFAESEHYARASLAARDPSGQPWAGAFALSARACTAAHRGAWSEARAALDELVSPGRAFEKPNAVAKFLAAAYGELLVARSAPADLDARRLAGMVGALRSARLDPYVLGAVCALAEVSDSLRDAALAATPEALLRVALDQGIVLTAGWVFLVPRVLARCAALRGARDESAALLERALAQARASGARAELALCLLDRARADAKKRGARRAQRDLDEAIPLLEALGMRPALHAALELRRAAAAPG